LAKKIKAKKEDKAQKEKTKPAFLKRSQSTNITKKKDVSSDAQRLKIIGLNKEDQIF